MKSNILETSHSYDNFILFDASKNALKEERMEGNKAIVR
jgi:hypothetical protein